MSGKTKIPYFYNTLHLSHKELVQALDKASKQEDRVFLLFKLTQLAMTPAQVHKRYYEQYPTYGYRIPLTSIRRCITNLTKKGFLEKTQRMEKGIYGTKNFKWIIKDERSDR